MKTNLFTAVLLLVGTSAMAQTPVNSQTQITQTRDYISGMLDRVNEVRDERFNRSKDYLVSGRALQKRITQALSDFRDTMSILSEGAFAVQVEQYNSLVRDSAYSETEKNERKAALYRSLQNQIGSMSATYQAGLSSLYRLEPQIIIVDAEEGYESVKFIFANGKKKRINSNSCDAAEITRLGSTYAVEKYLASQCQSKLCYSLLHGDYTSFLSDVYQQLDRDITVQLADGSTLVVKGLKSSIVGTKRVSTPNGNCISFAGSWGLAEQREAAKPDRDRTTQYLFDSLENIWNYSFGESYQKLPNKI